MQLDEYTTYDAVALADLLKQGDISAAELNVLANEALELVNPHLNLATAKIEPESFSAHNTAGAFNGVPFALKNLGHNWEGIPCSMGSGIAKGYVAESSGPLATRLKDSGLRPMVVTTSSEFGINGVTEPLADGPCGNPWNKTLSPGGSSGGSAAAVAAGVVPMAHASDGGGSIRVPAAWCGLVGLKPSRGRNPHGDGQTTDGSSWISVQHVVSRSVRDTAAALDVTSGPHPGDFVSLEKSPDCFLGATTREPGPLRIAFATQPVGAPQTHPECARAVVETAKLLEGLGHLVEEAAPILDYTHVVDLCFDLFLPGMIEGIEAISAKTGLKIGPDTLEPQTLATLDFGRSMSALTFKKRLSELSALSRLMGQFMLKYDVFLTPAVTNLPPALGQFSGHTYSGSDVSFWKKEMDLYTYAAIFSISGQPAMSVPMHFTPDGLPLGVQISAAINNEYTLFQLAGQMEQAKPWAHKRPGIHAGSI